MISDGSGARRLAMATIVAQVVFVLSWLVAGLWQRPAYNGLEHTISDMYAEDAPAGVVLVVVLTVCGLVTMAFAWWSLRPALGTDGWSVPIGCALLALSIFGLGDALSVIEREQCQLATPGCTAADQMANLGGRMDAILSTAGLIAFIAAGFTLAGVMPHVSGWGRWARPVRWLTIALAVSLAVYVAAESAGLGGLLERLLAAIGAAEVAVLAYAVLRIQPSDNETVQETAKEN